SKQTFTVIVGVDYSENAELAFDRALELCQAEPDAVLHAVNVAPMFLAAGDVESALLVDPHKRSADVEARLLGYVNKKVDQARARGMKVPDRIVAHVRWKAPGEEIAQLAADVEADLVVVGTHGRRGLSRVMLGSVAEVVVRLAPCPVLVVRPRGVVAVPVIEPPCPECLKTRAATAGADYWCAQHTQRHGRRQGHHSVDRVSADGTMPLLFHG
ncbi:MAG TPA: universal stress protein, partial [Polyangiaceae bacterium]|nr:universal stress protein [Polyangiaceae bacterium]